MNYIEINWDNSHLLTEGCSMIFNDLGHTQYTVRNIILDQALIKGDIFEHKTWNLKRHGLALMYATYITKQWLVIEVVDYDGDDDECI